MQAIPTKYAGVQFRSRLEAKWAAFFDLLEWRWEYEPYDLAGWIPDFILIGKDESTLVEVKPFTSLNEFDSVIKKIFYAQKKGKDFKEILLLGTSPCLGKKGQYEYESAALGWMNEGSGSHETEPWDEDGSEGYFCEASFNKLHSIGFSNSEMSYRDRITGSYTGNIDRVEDEEIKRLWRSAINKVQWRREGLSNPVIENPVEKIRNTLGYKYRVCKNGNAVHYVFKHCRLYEPYWTIFNIKTLERIEPSSLDEALEYIKKEDLL